MWPAGVDPGIGAVIATEVSRLGSIYDSVEQYLDEVKAGGLIDPWSVYWDRAYRHDLVEVGGHVTNRTSAAAVAEDRAYTATQHPYDRWQHLTMPTLLLRPPRNFAPGLASSCPPTTAIGSSARFPAPP